MNYLNEIDKLKNKLSVTISISKYDGDAREQSYTSIIVEGEKNN